MPGKGEITMSLNNILTKTRLWVRTMFREQADMAEKIELSLETLPWRTES
jgi:hypothetical protein